MKRRKVVGTLFVLVFAVLVVAGNGRTWMGMDAESKYEEPQHSASVEASESENVISEGSSYESEEKPDLYAVEVGEPNNIATNGYLEMELFDGRNRFDVYKELLESNNLVSAVNENGETAKTVTGHTIYVKSDDKDNSQYIVSGAELLPIEDGKIDFSASVMLRREESAERIRVFEQEAAYEEAVRNYKAGQEILQGSKQVPEGCIVLNGSLVPDAKYTVGEDGRFFVPMTSIAEAYDAQSEYYEAEGWLNVAVDLRHIVIPTKNAPSNVLNYYSAKNGKWYYQNETAPLWGDWFYLPETDKTEMPLEDIVRIFGWQIFVGQGIVSIVTDSLDNNDNFVLLPLTSSHVVIPLENVEGSEE